MWQKTIALTLIVLSAFRSPVPPTQEKVIRYKEKMIINEASGVSLVFFDVKDSRCPQGVQCFWAGNVTVELALETPVARGAEAKHVNMCLGDCRTLYKVPSFRDTDTLTQEFDGARYFLVLERISPDDRGKGKSEKSDYTISVRAEKKQ